MDESRSMGGRSELEERDRAVIAVAFAEQFEKFTHAQIAGDPSAAFADVLHHHFAAENSVFTLLHIESGEESRSPHDQAWFLVDDVVTMGQVAELVGDEVLYLDAFGRGGGGAPDHWLIDFVLSGVAYDLLKRGSRAAHEQLEAYLYREHRKEASSWTATRRPNAQLRRLVRSEPVWTLDHAQKVFRLEKKDTEDLLRQLGYERSRFMANSWVEKGHDHEGPHLG